jgi:hypothetical protein
VTRGTNASNAYESVDLRFNNDSGNNYAWHALSGFASGVISENQTSQNRINLALSAGAKLATNIFVPAVVDILDPFETTKNTTTRALSGGDRPTDGEQRVTLGSGAWFNTSAVTSILLAPRHALSWASGSRFSLYGIKAV